MRKDVLNVKGFKLFNQVDISTNQTSDIIYVPYLDNVGFVVSWSGVGLLGELKIEVSNQQENPNEPMIWSKLDFWAPITIIGNAGTHTINMNQVPFNAMRAIYVSTSGTGNLDLITQVKMV